MEENLSIRQRNAMESTIMNAENVPVHVTTIKLTKENYLYWAAVINMGIVVIGHIDYINGKKKQLSEDDLTWSL